MAPPDRQYGSATPRSGSVRPSGRSGSISSGSGAPPVGWSNLPSPPRGNNYYHTPIDQQYYSSASYAPPTPSYSYQDASTSRRSSVSGYASSSAGAGAGYSDQGSSGWAHGAQRGSDFDQTAFANNLVGALGRGDDTPFNFFSPGAAVDVDYDDFEEEAKKRPKTPPDCCAVCGATSTPEWRKGPAGIRSLCNGCGLLAAKRAKDRQNKGYSQPTTIEHMQKELIAIGAERFKSPAGDWALPPNTIQRIHETIARTERAAATMVPKPRKVRAADRQAAGALVNMSRRASFSSTNASANAPLSMPPGSGTRGRRAGSLASNPSRPGTSGSGATQVYPSSSYAGATLLNPAYGGSGYTPSSVRSTGTPGPSSRRSYSPVPAGPPRSYSPGPPGSKMSLNAITHPLPPPPPGVIWGYPSSGATGIVRGRSPAPPGGPASSSRTSTPTSRPPLRSGSSVRSLSLTRR